MFKPSNNFITDRAFLWILLLFGFQTVLSLPCIIVVTYWERTGLLDLLYMMFSCVFVTFPYGVLGQLWYFIVWIPDLCLLPDYV